MNKKVYEFDEALRKYGHVPIRTPPHWPEYQLMEFVFGRVKWRLLDKQVDDGFEGTFKDYLKLIPEIVNKVRAEGEVLLSCRHHITRKRHDDYQEVLKTHGVNGKLRSKEDYIFIVTPDDDDDDGDSDSEPEDDPDEREQIENPSEIVL